MAEAAPGVALAGKLGSLEIGRFIAASIVVLDHVQTSLLPHLAADSHSRFTDIMFPGAFAVQYFFVLSGFVMMKAHAADFGRLAAVPRFWWRRICRIYPMYWIALALPCYFFRDLITPALLAQLVSLQPVFPHDYVAPAWSLRYETSFYIGFGLCLLPYVGRWLLAAWVAAIVWVSLPLAARMFLHLPPPLALVWLVFHDFRGFFTFFEFYFFAGLLGGWIFLKFHLGRFAGLALILVGVAGLTVQMPAMKYGHEFGWPIVPAFTGPAFAGIIVGLAVLERCNVFRTGAAARRLGAMSYPLYILHATMLLVFDRQFVNAVFHTGQWWVAAVGGLAAIYAVSAAFAFLVDQPLQKLLRGRRRVHRVAIGSV